MSLLAREREGREWKGASCFTGVHRFPDQLVNNPLRAGAGLPGLGGAKPNCYLN